MSDEPMDDETWDRHIAKWRAQIVGDEYRQIRKKTITWDKYTTLKIDVDWLERNYPETLAAWKAHREEVINTQPHTHIPEEVCELVELLVATGEKHPKNRKTIANSIKAMLKAYPGYSYYRSVSRWEGLNK